MGERMAAPCSVLAWDSAFFGFQIGQVTGEILSDLTGRAVLEWSEANGVRCLYFLADPSSRETASLAHRLGFIMVDVRVELSLKNSLPRSAMVPGFGLRPARPADVAALQTIARGAHRDSRFFFDLQFPRTRAEDLFATWIATDCAGRATVLTVEHEGVGGAGYVSCSLNDESNTGRINLLAVASEFRGMGLGKALVLGALDWFSSVDVRSALVVTQVRNVAAQRLYQTAGFRTESVKIWYHRWFSRPSRE